MFYQNFQSFKKSFGETDLVKNSRLGFGLNNGLIKELVTLSLIFNNIHPIFQIRFG